MDLKRARKVLAQPQVWHAGDVSASSEQGEACKLTVVLLAHDEVTKKHNIFPWVQNLGASRWYLVLFDIKFHLMALPPLQKMLRRKHLEVMVAHLVVCEHIHAAPRIHGRVHPVPVVVVACANQRAHLHIT